MRAVRLKSLRAVAVVAVTALLSLFAFGPAQPASATTYVPISGAGSTYAYPALNQWATDLVPQGARIDYKPVGSAAGRSEYRQNQVDFTGSDIAFLTQSNPDPFGGDDGSTDFAYSYIPDVAGGLSFLYNLQVGGNRITDMRLSGTTLAEIFTGHIKNWNDARITHDYGAQLPNIPITVVTRSDGAGESYFLSRWMWRTNRSLWVNFCQAQGGPRGCGTGPTEFYPGQSAGFKALNGSDVVSGYIKSAPNNGAIGYAEFYYAKANHIPVVNMLNSAGYYVPPSATNVAIALEHAQIDENQSHVTFLMQNLDQVYTNGDPRSYPLSAYSYLIVPRDKRVLNGHTYSPLPFTKAKGVTLSTYSNYILCQAQQTAIRLGYSPLPKPMVVGGFIQEAHIPGAVPSPAAHNYSGCSNPAYLNGVDTVTASAPYPSPCQKVGAPLNCSVVNGRPVSTTSSSGNGGTGAGGAGAGGAGAGGAGAGGTKGSSATASGLAGAGAKVDPNTGQVIGGTQDTSLAAAHPVFGLSGNPAEDVPFGVLAAVLLIAAVGVPAVLGAGLQQSPGRRRNGGRR